MRAFGVKLGIQALILCGVASLASASTIINPFSFSQPNATTTNFDQVFPVAMFDSNLGTLTGVSIQVTYSGTMGYSVSNPSGTKTFTDSQPLAMTFQILTPAGLIVPVSLSALVCPSGCAISGPGTFSFTGAASGSNSGNALVPGSFEAAGGGSLNLTSEFQGQSGGSFSVTGGGGAASTTPIASLNAEGTITYTYSSPESGVPEPATMLLVGCALVGAGVRFRRKGKKAA